MEVIFYLSNKFRTVLIVILISFCVFNNSSAQRKDITDLPELSLKKKKHPNIKPADDFDNIKNFPFQFGLELGTSVLREDEYANIGFIGSMDVNLFRRLVFFRFEMGVLGLNADRITSTHGGDTDVPAYGSLGINVRAITIDKSRFFASLSMGAVTDGFGYFGVFSLKYVYNVDRYLGFTSSIRYPFYGRTPFITLGLQFFTN